jgi:hypothetical protein
VTVPALRIWKVCVPPCARHAGPQLPRVTVMAASGRWAHPARTRAIRITSVTQPARFAWTPVALVAAAVVALLAITSTRYGYHRDELYFRVLGQHPAWGYIDQPPATPLLARLSIAIFGDSVWGLRVPAIVCAAVTVFLVALIAREAGGGPLAQALAAAGATGTFPLVFGHIFITASLDLVVWLAVILFAFRALLRDQPRWWLAAGVTVGLGLYNKHLVVLLLIALAGGLLLAGPRQVLRSPWTWAGAGLALVLGSPNLVYQVTHDFPQLKMAEALRENNGDESMALLLPFQLITIGVPLVPIMIAGIVRMLRDRRMRAFAVAYFLLIVVVFLVAGQPYYTGGLVLTLYAVGSVATADWLSGRAGHSHWLGAAGTSGRRALVAAAVGVNLAVSVVSALPVFPLSTEVATTMADINQATQDQVGWPEYVSQIAAAYRSLPPDEAARAVVITSNYGEYGALARYGGVPADRLYSGQNELRNLGGPPESTDVAVLVGLDGAQGRFDSCTAAGRLDSGYDVDNEEQGVPIAVCRGPREPWSTLWPRFYHYD